MARLRGPESNNMLHSKSFGHLGAPFRVFWQHMLRILIISFFLSLKALILITASLGRAFFFFSSSILVFSFDQSRLFDPRSRLFYPRSRQFHPRCPHKIRFADVKKGLIVNERAAIVPLFFNLAAIAGKRAAIGPLFFQFSRDRG